MALRHCTLPIADRPVWSGGFQSRCGGSGIRRSGKAGRPSRRNGQLGYCAGETLLLLLAAWLCSALGLLAATLGPWTLVWHAAIPF